MADDLGLQENFHTCTLLFKHDITINHRWGLALPNPCPHFPVQRTRPEEAWQQHEGDEQSWQRQGALQALMQLMWEPSSVMLKGGWWGLS
mmetsp:Transcript_14781/g.39870  ORF Transcript_14781/g.39870 Transcript_14781/m.39870 type:complete len:90 (-) Transcript_14781:38-307(-)